MYKIKSAQVFLNIDIPVKISDIEAVVEYQVFVYKGNSNDIKFDKDIIDVKIKYLGLEVKTVRKFLDNFKEIGLDVEEKIYEKANLELTDEVLQGIANQYKKILF